MAKKKTEKTETIAQEAAHGETVMFPGKADQFEKLMGEVLTEGLSLVAELRPDLTENNPVWHWALADDHVTFVFRDGRKYTLTY